MNCFIKVFLFFYLIAFLTTKKYNDSKRYHQYKKYKHGNEKYTRKEERMENIIINSFKEGNTYTRKNIMHILGYKGETPLQRGIVAPANKNTILLFSTMDEKANHYTDKFTDTGIEYNGEDKHGNDKRIIKNLMCSGEDRIIFFYRQNSNDPFIYYGEVELVDYTLFSEKPSIFIFEKIDHDANNADFEDKIYDQFLRDNEYDVDEGTHEGKKKIVKHITYERSRKNREIAIRIHGHTCSICGMDFNKVYGKELADSYIEVHHTIPLYLTGEMKINPEKDLLPVCPNCHRMLHRRKKSNISIDRLKEIVLTNKQV